MSKPSKRAGAPVQINISQKMLDAGVRAMEECEEYHAPLDHVVAEVLRAVFRTRAQQEGVKMRVVFPAEYL